jgi:uncharacterized protein YprB with RNaseH-like and TPR domain
MKLSKKVIKARDFLLEHPGYMKWNVFKIYSLVNPNPSKISESNIISRQDIIKAKKLIRDADKFGKKFESIKRIDSKDALKILTKEIKKDNIEKPRKFKRLFFDIETSYNIVSTWNVGYKLNIGHENIIKERAIICVCWKWAGESKVYSLEWNKGDDKQLLIDFVEVLNSADEIIGHNSDRFDEKWLRTRALYHGIPMIPKYQSVDTLKLARNGFKFNSNRLDYLGKFMGFGGKKDTGGFKLWQSIIMDNDVKAMKDMVTYCKRDVTLLEKVFDKLNPYTVSKTHVGVLLGLNKCTCPNCGSNNSENGRGPRISASGVKKYSRKCLDCFKYYTISESNLNKSK